ncbi:hypothetical protein HanPSC8_Chr15g0660351 [Helianthus annuus]|nr:hypothetical protein HanPSC8_Chr15g0660351 [Helianthus annuus]
MCTGGKNSICVIKIKIPQQSKVSKMKLPSYIIILHGVDQLEGHISQLLQEVGWIDLWISYRSPYGLQDALPRSAISLLCSEEGCIKGSALINLSDRLHQVLKRAEFFCSIFLCCSVF